MTIVATEARSSRPMNMDIEQLRAWATFMDRAMVVSLFATVLAIAALGVATWLSFRFGSAVRAHEQAAFHQYKVEMGKHAAELEQEVSRLRGRTLELEQAAADANEQAARAARDSAAANDKARTAEVDAEEVRKRVEELGRAVKEAAARAAEAAAAKEQAQLEPAAPSQPEPSSPLVASLRKYAGTRAALYVLDEVPDGAAVGAAIAGPLAEAEWVPATWTWTGVSGIVGVVVLIKEGSDPTTDEAASALVDGLRAAGFNAAKGNWPADWRRFRGTLNGPQTPSPTDAPIRIVVGARAR